MKRKTFEIGFRSTRCRRFAKLFCFAAALLFFFTSALSAQDRAAVPNRLIVATREVPPFAMKDQGGQWIGLSIELLRQIKADLQSESDQPIELEFREMGLEAMLDALERGEVDLAAAALTVNYEREKRFDFTHPIHSSGLGMAVRVEQGAGWRGVLQRVFSATFLKIVVGLLLVMLTTGFLIYFLERRKNPEQFGGGWVRGVGTGLWWAAVTATTVGYGDKAPRTLAGRIVALVWMFAGILIITSFMAAVTAALTVTQIQSRISGPRDLPRLRVATVADSTSEHYLVAHHFVFGSYDTAAAAVESLARGDSDAVVYDAPVLRYLTYHHHGRPLHVLPAVFQRQDYAFALPADSPLRERINQILLRAIGRPEWEDTLQGYLGVQPD